MILYLKYITYAYRLNYSHKINTVPKIYEKLPLFTNIYLTLIERQTIDMTKDIEILFHYDKKNNEFIRETNITINHILVTIIKFDPNYLSSKNALLKLADNLGDEKFKNLSIYLIMYDFYYNSDDQKQKDIENENYFNNIINKYILL